MKEITAQMLSSPFVCPSILVRLAMLRKMRDRMVFFRLLTAITKRSIFMPPEVEPEQPQTKEQSIRMPMLPVGQRLVSAVAKPVVVDREHTWNAAMRNAFRNDG